jgi:hypothetical protein
MPDGFLTHWRFPFLFNGRKRYSFPFRDDDNNRVWKFPFNQPGAGYHADAVHFAPGTLVSRGNVLTGVTGTFNRCLVSVWLKWSSPSDTAHLAESIGLGNFSLRISPDDDQPFRFLTFDPDGNGDTLLGHLMVPATPVYMHCLAAYDRVTPSNSFVFLDGVDRTERDFTNTADPDFSTETDFAIGGVNLDCDVAELYIAFDQWLDLTDPTNVAKFIAAGKPVSLGADGSTPTGTAPTIFMSGGAAGFAANRGTGGAFTLSSGSLTDASSPSD